MFELTKQKVKLSSVNPRAEIHGEERKPAFDLKFEAACCNDVLIHFHPELRQMLFKKNEQPDLVDQSNDKESLTALRFPKMGGIKWDWEGAGYALTVPYGIDDKSAIKLGDCKVDDFKFVPQNGGTVMLSWRTICHPKTEEVGKLCEFIQREIDITLTPPEAKNVQELFGDEKKKSKEKKAEPTDPAAGWPFPKKGGNAAA